VITILLQPPVISSENEGKRFYFVFLSDYSAHRVNVVQQYYQIPNITYNKYHGQQSHKMTDISVICYLLSYHRNVESAILV